MKICDLTQFYSPLSGGVKRYVHEKIDYVRNHSPEDEHVLIVPGPKTEVTTNARSRVYSIHSPLVSRSSRYRALLNLRAIEEILERERIERSISNWLESDCCRARVEGSGGWVLSFAFPGSISPGECEIFRQTRHPAGHEIGARLCAQTLQSLSAHARALRGVGRGSFRMGRAQCPAGATGSEHGRFQTGAGRQQRDSPVIRN